MRPLSAGPVQREGELFMRKLNESVRRCLLVAFGLLVITVSAPAVAQAHTSDAQGAALAAVSTTNGESESCVLCGVGTGP